MKRIGRRSTSDAAHLLAALDSLTAGRRRQRLRGPGVIGDRVQVDRRAVQRRCLRELHAAGYRIRKLQNLNATHLEVIVNTWRAQGLGAASLRTYVSYLKILCRWLGKPQLITQLEVLIEPERHLTRGSTVEGQCSHAKVSVSEILAAAQKVDARFACILQLIAIFGYTPRAAWLVRPWQLRATADTHSLIEWARTFAPTPQCSMIPPGDSLARWKRRFYRYCQRIGLTRRTSRVTPRQLPSIRPFAQRRAAPSLHDADDGG